MKNWRYDLYLKTAQLKMDTLINRYHSEIQGSLPMQFYVTPFMLLWKLLWYYG